MVRQKTAIIEGCNSRRVADRFLGGGNVLNVIIAAINNRQVLTFTYNGLARVVEPHAVGVSTAGNEVLRCFQTSGGHIIAGHEWDFCKLSDIRGLAANGHVFVGERPGYRRGDRNMTKIYAQL